MLTLEITGEAGDTITEAGTDAAQNLDDDSTFVFHDATTNKNVSGVLITVDSNDIKFCFGSTPVQGGLGHVLSVGQSLYLRNIKNARAFNYINKTNGANASLMITPFYGEY